MISTVMNITPTGLLIYMDRMLSTGIEIPFDDLIQTIHLGESINISECIYLLKSHKVPTERLYIIAAWIQKQYPNNTIDWSATFQIIILDELQVEIEAEHNREKGVPQTDWGAMMRAMEIGKEVDKIKEPILLEMTKALEKFNLIQ